VSWPSLLLTRSVPPWRHSLIRGMPETELDGIAGITTPTIHLRLVLPTAHLDTRNQCPEWETQPNSLSTFAVIRSTCGSPPASP
jgi:hypothetical protein